MSDLAAMSNRELRDLSWDLLHEVYAHWLWNAAAERAFIKHKAVIAEIVRRSGSKEKE